MKLAVCTGALRKGAFYKQAQSILALALMSLGLALPASLGAQDKDEASVELEIAVVSNYVWRGENIFADKAAQDNEVPSASTGAPAFQPSITFYPEAEGLYFNIWVSRALSARSDKDINDDGEVTIGEDCLLDATDPADPVDLVCEDNGLARSDEVDYTLGYEKESNIGTVGFGILNYSYVHHKGKSFSDTEIFFSYSPAGDILSNLYLNVYSAVRDTTDYYQIGYGYELELSDDLGLSFDIAAGYQIDENIDGWKDITGSVGVSAYGIDLSLNAASRGNSKFYDESEDGNYGDFKTEDPETGELKDIPKTLMWLYVGYTHEF